MEPIKGFTDEYRYLSNFYASDVLFEGLMFRTSENAYQAAKTLDLNERQKFINVSPRMAKQMGRHVALRADWEDSKYQIMKDILLDKFKRNFKLMRNLVDTGDAYLEEKNFWHDCYWGRCYCEKCCGTGKNALGQILMELRGEFQTHFKKG